MSIFDQRGDADVAVVRAAGRTCALRRILPTRVIPYGDPGYPRNGRNSPLAAASAAQNYSIPDGPDEHVLNEAIWRSIRGPHSHMPGPAPGSSAGED